MNDRNKEIEFISFRRLLESTINDYTPSVYDLKNETQSKINLCWGDN
jgi:hypothetical protein